MIVIPFFLEGLASGFYVHWWYALPQGWYNLSLDVGELWKVTLTVSSQLYTSLEEDSGLGATMQMWSSKGFSGTVDELRDCSELKTKKSSDHLNELLKPCSTQLLIFILYSPSELKSERRTNTNVLPQLQNANHSFFGGKKNRLK